MPLGIPGDADARVPDAETYPLAAVELFEQFGAQHDFTAMGELERIADEVVQHLRQAQRIDDVRRAEACVSVLPQHQAFGAGNA